MSHFPRLQKTLRRQGVQVEYTNGIYRLRNEFSEATILLPETLPLEEKAVKQLLAFAAVRDPHSLRGVCKACATPDFHPGSIAPVGLVVATDPDFLIPAAIGTDVNCGMRLITTGLSQTALAPLKEALVQRLTRVLLENGRDIPVRTDAFKALFDVGPAALIDKLSPLGLWAGVDRGRLHAELSACIGLDSFAGNARHAPEALTGSRDVIRDPSLGTAGAGNHPVGCMGCLGLWHRSIWRRWAWLRAMPGPIGWYWLRWCARRLRS